MEEIWKPIKNFEELYEVSNLGRVKSLAKRGKPERIMKQAISHKGYPTLSLCKNAKSTRRAVHRLVAQAFIDNPDNLPQVNHIDGNKQNNNVENLEWCDNSYNQIHANKMGLNEHRIQRVKEYKEQGREKEIQQALIDVNNKYNGKTKLPKDLCYLEGKLRKDYLHDMKLCQEFAVLNRDYIAYKICKELSILCNNYFHTIHNYINFEDNIVRKGSISARKGEKVIIPMNMRDGCIIGVGKGNEDWNYSAPHGAGRTMSRNIAKQSLNMEDYKKSMEGIYTTSVNEETIDEAPMVYKPMEEIIEHIKDTVEVEKIIKPIYNFKASE